MIKNKRTLIVSVLLILFSVICFYYWEDQQSIKTLNEGLPEGVRIEKKLIGNYKIINEINNYTFETPSIWKGIEEIKYLTEREGNGYKFTSINVRGKTSENGVIAVVKFESKPDIDLIIQADLFFKAFELEGNFTENKVEEIKTKGGVILPDSHSEESRLGTIIALGDEVDSKFKLGDQILVAFFSGIVLHFPGEGMSDDTIRMITQSEIMAKVK